MGTTGAALLVLGALRLRMMRWIFLTARRSIPSGTKGASYPSEGWSQEGWFATEESQIRWSQWNERVKLLLFLASRSEDCMRVKPWGEAEER